MSDLPDNSRLSPCNRICQLDVEMVYCVGCFRTMTEISSWRGLSRDDRLAILAELPERRARLEN